VGSGQAAAERLAKFAVIGELALDGAAQPTIRSPRTELSRKRSGSRSIVPEADFFHPVDYRITIPRLFKNTAFSREKRQSLKTTCKSRRKV